MKHLYVRVVYIGRYAAYMYNGFRLRRIVLRISSVTANAALVGLVVADPDCTDSAGPPQPVERESMLPWFAARSKHAGAELTIRSANA